MSPIVTHCMGAQLGLKSRLGAFSLLTGLARALPPENEAFFHILFFLEVNRELLSDNSDMNMVILTRPRAGIYGAVHLEAPQCGNRQLESTT